MNDEVALLREEIETLRETVRGKDEIILAQRLAVRAAEDRLIKMRALLDSSKPRRLKGRQ